MDVLYMYQWFIDKSECLATKIKFDCYFEDGHVNVVSDEKCNYLT